MLLRSFASIPFFLALAAAGLLASASPGQGTLTPSGPPGPTLRTLDQIEPRTLVNAINTPGSGPGLFVISQPGSYFLGADVSGVSGRNGILIAADDVTLDLNGYSVNGTAGALIGITSDTARRGVRVFGGRVSGWPTAGIVLTGSGTTVSEVTVTNSGAAIVLDQAGGTRISRCTATDIAVIAAYTLCLSADSVEHCTLQNISGTGGLTAISAGVQVSHCVLQTLSANGLLGISAVGQVLDCTLLSLTGTTITGIGASRVSRCQVSGAGSAATTTLVGISATFVSECLVGGMTQGGVGSGTSTAINALHCLNTAVLNAYFNGSGATPGLRIGMQAAGCTVSNVHNSGTGSAAGIAVNAFASSRGLVSQCRVDNCETGIVTGDGSQVLQCTVIGCDNTGIQVGQRCGVLDCTVSGNGLVSTSPGISTDIRTQVMRCNSNDNSGDGIAILGGCRVEGCTAENSTLGSGIRVVSGSGSRIEANHVRDNHRYGIEATAGDVIARNTAGGNVLGAYLPASGNNFAPVQLPATATNPAANF